MLRLEISPDYPSERRIQQAIAALRDGELVIYPTDTVYGLGCNLLNKKGVERIYQLKGNDKRKLLSFICPDLKEIAQYALVSTPAYKIMKRLTPGPYTFLLEASRLVPKILLERRKTVGIRVPDHPISQRLLQGLGAPIISTSATLPGQPYLTDIDEISEIFQHYVDVLIDSGPGSSEPSSIIDLSGEHPVVVRAGKGDLSLFT
ncbi:MAG TPA: L-threonylcarbamoyladenylate synthase [bacterium]|nr:L-threonylcarbamoyladenylate synthase [bacterium]HQG45585.1 L-threonylcarbamoyladenylate synthase [bacterium]HQI50185.1 L-threonylcarbamoyladenylate synthase [bacterium]HQJ64471.1 L-threonylcarbamoyladenylate synthase [bacterium]